MLESADDGTPSEYLTVHQFSDLERRAGRKVSMDWELKRREAKHGGGRKREEQKGSRLDFSSFHVRKMYLVRLVILRITPAHLCVCRELAWLGRQST